MVTDAVALFDPDGAGEEVERWLGLVYESTRELVAPNPLGGMIPNAPSASALAVRRLRAPVRPAAIAAALERCPTLLDALIYLHRRNDIRPTTTAERKNGREHRTHVVGEPLAFAMEWVHGRCTWQSRRNGAELFDYVAQMARGGIVDAEVRESVVPQLRVMDTVETRRAFWQELLSRCPHIAVELARDAEQEPKTTETDWRDVQRRLLELYGRGEAYTSVSKLAEALGCSRATIHKAIKNSNKLKGWQARHTKSKGTPRASSLTEIVADKTTRTAETDPSDVLTDEDIDNAMRRLIENAGAEEKAQLNELSEDERRKLVMVFYEQNLDQEPSPLEDDVPDARPRKVIQHKRV